MNSHCQHVIDFNWLTIGTCQLGSQIIMKCFHLLLVHSVPYGKLLNLFCNHCIRVNNSSLGLKRSIISRGIGLGGCILFIDSLEDKNIFAQRLDILLDLRIVSIK